LEIFSLQPPLSIVVFPPSLSPRCEFCR
jgi:hypothetical protein